MKGNKKVISVIYGLISFFVIVSIIFSVGYGARSTGNNNAFAGAQENQKIEYTSPSSTAEKPKKQKNAIDNPYKDVLFDTCIQKQVSVDKNKVVSTQEDKFVELFAETEAVTEEWSSRDSKAFLEYVKGTDTILAAFAEQKNNAAAHYSALLKNRNLVAMDIQQEIDLTNHAIKVWDDTLTLSMPINNIYAMADTMIVLSENDTRNSQKQAITKGQYFNLVKTAPQSKAFPVIRSISIQQNTIRIQAENFIRIEWITENGQLAGYGEEMNPYATDVSQWNSLSDSVTKPSKYLRAVVIGEEGTLFTQAFGLK